MNKHIRWWKLDYITYHQNFLVAYSLDRKEYTYTSYFFYLLRWLLTLRFSEWCSQLKITNKQSISQSQSRPSQHSMPSLYCSHWLSTVDHLGPWYEQTLITIFRKLIQTIFYPSWANHFVIYLFYLLAFNNLYYISSWFFIFLFIICTYNFHYPVGFVGTQPFHSLVFIVFCSGTVKWDLKPIQHW